jgi:cell wall-associated NlpC family hydrolase
MADKDAAKDITGLRDKVVAAAKDLALKYKNSAYQMGGKTTSAFDCSYFVYLVLNKVFSDYQYLDSAAISATPSVFKKSEVGRGGDVVFFPAQKVPYAVKKGDKKEYPNHVGIVLDSATWVGRQSSSLGLVLFSNPWWGSRSCSFYSYTSLDAAIARSGVGDFRRHFA